MMILNYLSLILIINLATPSTFTRTTTAAAAATLWWVWILIFHNIVITYQMHIFKGIFR